MGKHDQDRRSGGRPHRPHSWPQRRHSPGCRASWRWPTRTRPPRRSSPPRRAPRSRRLDEIVERSDVDAILICTPTTTHADLIERGARAGKAVFCEKPVDLSSARIEACLATVEKAGTPLMIGFNRRFDPNFASLRRRLADGEVGEVELVTILSRDPGPPPVSYIATLGRPVSRHDDPRSRHGALPAARRRAGGSACGRLVPRRSGHRQGRRRRYGGGAAEDRPGKIAQISNSRRATYGYDQRVEVHGSKGMIRAGNIHRTTVEVANASGFTADPVQDFFLERYAEAYRAELAAFLDAVAAGKACDADRPGRPEGAASRRRGATESAQSGKPVRV